MSGAAYFCKIGGAIGDIGEIKFGFTAPDYAYENIGTDLGVTKLSGSNDRRGVVFGANYPRPPRIRVTYKQGNLGGGTGNDVPRSAIRYCDPDKVGQVLNGALNDKKVKVRNTEYSIVSTSIA